MINAEDIAKLALELQCSNQCTSEVYYRNVIGRWYYSAFSKVKAWLNLNFPDSLDMVDGATHQKIRECCMFLQRKHIDLNFSRLSRLLGELHHRRVKADYHLHHTVITSDMEEAQIKYDEIIEVLEILDKKYF